MEVTDTKEITAEQAAEQISLISSKVSKHHPSGGPHDLPWMEVLRPLTEQEWREVCLYVLKFDFPINLGAGVYGFFVAIYDHHVAPIIEKPKVLLVIEDRQLPMASEHPGFAGKPALLKTLEQITHRPRNLELLAFYGFESLKDSWEYAY